MLWEQGKPYSQDLRERVFAEADEGAAVGEIATLLRVSASYVSKVLGRRRLTGETTARPQRCHLQRKLAPLYAAIRTRVTEHPDATIDELQVWLRQAHQVAVSSGLICETLALLGLTRKKSRCARPNRTVPMLPRHGPSGGTPSQAWIPLG
jgi:transposase